MFSVPSITLLCVKWRTNYYFNFSIIDTRYEIKLIELRDPRVSYFTLFGFRYPIGINLMPFHDVEKKRYSFSIK